MMFDPSALGLPNVSPVLIAVLLIWSLIWKGLALWKAARFQQKTWFVVILITSTVGILDILYIYFWAKDKSES